MRQKSSFWAMEDNNTCIILDFQSSAILCSRMLKLEWLGEAFSDGMWGRLTAWAGEMW